MDEVTPAWVAPFFIIIFTIFFSIHLLNNSLSGTSMWMVLAQLTTLAFIGAIAKYRIM